MFVGHNSTTSNIHIAFTESQAFTQEATRHKEKLSNFGLPVRLRSEKMETLNPLFPKMVIERFISKCNISYPSWSSTLPFLNFFPDRFPLTSLLGSAQHSFQIHSLIKSIAKIIARRWMMAPLMKKSHYFGVPCTGYLMAPSDGGQFSDLSQAPSEGLGPVSFLIETFSNYHFEIAHCSKFIFLHSGRHWIKKKNANIIGIWFPEADEVSK